MGTVDELSGAIASVVLIVRFLPLVRSIVRCAGLPRTGDSEKPALQGFPALSPGLTGESASASGFHLAVAKNPKWITAMYVTNRFPGGFWEDRGYNWFCGV